MWYTKKCAYQMGRTRRKMIPKMVPTAMPIFAPMGRSIDELVVIHVAFSALKSLLPPTPLPIGALVALAVVDGKGALLVVGDGEIEFGEVEVELGIVRVGSSWVAVAVTTTDATPHR